MKLTLVILILLAAVSILGTVIPQREGVMEFAQGLSPGMQEVFETFQLFDVYHSYWFILLISALTLNLVVCSINRFPTVIHVLKTKPSPDRKKPFEDIPSDQSFITTRNIQDTAAKLHSFMTKNYSNIAQTEIDKGFYFYGEKGRFSLFGVYIVHLSILFILIGAMIGSRFGFEAFATIPEGDSIETVHLRKSRQPKSLGFKVECIENSVKFYEDGTPKEYRSDLRIFDGDSAQDFTVLVNHPARFQGIAFYLSSFGKLPGENVDVGIKNEREGNETRARVEIGKKIGLPGGEGSFVVDEVREDFMRMGMGPAARFTVLPIEGEPVSFWAFLYPERVRARFSESVDKFPKLNPSSFKPYTFSLDGIEERNYAVFQVNRDPGVPMVWIGFLLIMGGLVVSFFMSHRRIRIRVEPAGEGSRISVAGTSNKNPVGLERELKQITASLKEKLK